MYYPLSKANLSPYVGGALSYAWASGPGGDEAGLALRATGGLLFGRLSSVQIRAELSIFSTLFERQVSVGETMRDYGPMLSVGIGF
jgi:hypothetical protein